MCVSGGGGVRGGGGRGGGDVVLSLGSVTFYLLHPVLGVYSL